MTMDESQLFQSISTEFVQKVWTDGGRRVLPFLDGLRDLVQIK
jgi:hypothetical protein